MSKGSYQEAEKFLIKAIEILNTSSRPYFHLGRLYQGLDKIDKAIEMFSEATEMGDKDAKAKLNSLKK